MRVCPVREDFVVNINLSASVNVSRAAFAARCPRAVSRSRLYNCLVGEALRSILVELHENCLKRWLNNERHQEKKRKEAERCKEHEEGGCVEKQFLFQCSVDLVTHFAQMMLPLTLL